MSYLPLKTVQFLVSEFENKLTGYTVKTYSHDDFMTIYSLNDSLLIMVELYGQPASPCYNAEQMYGKDRQNPFLEFPIEGRTYYTIRIAELTPNQIGFKYNHAKFIREMEEITNIWGLRSYVHYARFGSEITDWWNPDGVNGPKLTVRINEMFPELQLPERIAVWDGAEYNFIVIEMESSAGEVHRAVAYTTQKPHSYMVQFCQNIIDTGTIHGNAISNGIIERNMNSAFTSWKGISRTDRLEQHLQYFWITMRLKDKFDAYAIVREIYADVNSGKYAHAPRSTYTKPVNKWVSEELVYNLTRKMYREHNVLYQHKPFFLRSSIGGQMSYDVFISGLNVAIEYQGRQHFEPVDFFGGEEAYKRQKMRDAEKAALSIENGVKLVYINYWEDISPALIEERVGIPAPNSKKKRR